MTTLKHYFARLLDLPCGDFQWIGQFLKGRNDIDYTGIDIVPALIRNHRAKFVNRNDWKFINTDIIEHRLNESYDLILCRMLLQHLVTADVISMLKRFSQSGSAFLLTTSFSEKSYYQEVRPNSQYRFRFINLEIPPFSLARPICLSRDGSKGEHYVGLWMLPLIRVSNCKLPKKEKAKFVSLSKWFHFCQ